VKVKLGKTITVCTVRKFSPVYLLLAIKALCRFHWWHGGGMHRTECCLLSLLFQSFSRLASYSI